MQVFADVPTATQYRYGGDVAAILVYTQGRVYTGIDEGLSSLESCMANIAIGIKTKLIKLSDNHEDVECFILTRSFEWLC